MKNLRLPPITFLLALFAFAGCEKNEAEQTDHLQQIGILGQWKLEIRAANGISHLAVECCDYLEFKTDSEPSDFKGEFTAFGAGYETHGLFALNTSRDTIHFDYRDKQRSYGFRIADDRITFTYSENDREIVEDWRKEM